MNQFVFYLLVAETALTASAQTCDRTCLEGFVDRYVDAMVAHDPARLPLSKGVRYTENGQHLELGEALWSSIAGKGAYKLVIADTEAGQVTAFVSLREEDRDPAKSIPLMAAIRLRIEKGQITEAEQVVQRSAQSANGFDKIGKPDPVYLTAVAPADRLSRAELVRVANAYFTSMQQNDGRGDYPFADDCNRIENGGPTTNVPAKAGEKRPDPKTSTSYSAQWSCMEQFKSGLLHFVSRIRDRRYVAVDSERGLVFVYAFFDHAAGKSRHFETPDGRSVVAGPTSPWTWEIAELFKIEKGPNGKGLIHRIEAIMERAPYGMDSGWSSWEDGRSDQARDESITKSRTESRSGSRK
jgi:hypothetical protein